MSEARTALRSAQQVFDGRALGAPDMCGAARRGRRIFPKLDITSRTQLAYRMSSLQI